MTRTYSRTSPPAQEKYLGLGAFRNLMRAMHTQKNAANELFRQGDYEGALAAYQVCSSLLNLIGELPLIAVEI